MKNTPEDLKNILFAQLEDLCDSDNENKMPLLIKRAEASVKISQQIINIEKLKIQQKNQNGKI